MNFMAQMLLVAAPVGNHVDNAEIVFPENNNVSIAYDILQSSESRKKRLENINVVYKNSTSDEQKIIKIFKAYLKNKRKSSRTNSREEIRLVTTAISHNNKKSLEFLKNIGYPFDTSSDKVSYLSDCIEGLYYAQQFNAEFDETIFDFLLENGASLYSLHGILEQQPLYLAIKYNFAEVAQKLIYAGAKMNEYYIQILYFSNTMNNFVCGIKTVKQALPDETKKLLSKISIS